MDKGELVTVSYVWEESESRAEVDTRFKKLKNGKTTYKNDIIDGLEDCC